ncbi:MAG: hypothetical protein OQK46_05315 [Gammaproteobacteria bacterium]|nr:hypothetical protein [Gammaproteobacteria bacterium]
MPARVGIIRFTTGAQGSGICSIIFTHLSVDWLSIHNASFFRFITKDSHINGCGSPFCHSHLFFTARQLFLVICARGADCDGTVITIVDGFSADAPQNNETFT